VDDVRLAVTEACTNVVRHAYPDRSGTLDVVVRPEEERLEVVVADSGKGMGPSPDRRGPGLGLPLIAALADSFDIDESVSSGSRLVMSFVRSRPARLPTSRSRRWTSRSSPATARSICASARCAAAAVAP